MKQFKIPFIEYFPLKESDTEQKFSILIPSWNNLPYLKFCLNSIRKNSTFKHQIIVHVNQGEDGTIEWVRNAGYAYTFSKENAGVCYALNAMAKLVTTQYVLFLNDDMYVCPNWDGVLLDAINKSSNQMFYYSGTMLEPTYTRNLCSWAPQPFGSTIETFKEKELLQFITNNKFKNWFGGCWPPSVVTKKLWDAVGGYSVEFSPGFYSDPDFAMKLWQAGVRDFRGFGDSLVYHFQCKSTGRVTKNNGRKTFAKKWGIPSSYFYKNILQLGQPVKEFKPLNLNKNISYYFAKLRAIFIGLQ